MFSIIVIKNIIEQLFFCFWFPANKIKHFISYWSYCNFTLFFPFRSLWLSLGQT